MFPSSCAGDKTNKRAKQQTHASSTEVLEKFPELEGVTPHYELCCNVFSAYTAPVPVEGNSSAERHYVRREVRYAPYRDTTRGFPRLSCPPSPTPISLILRDILIDTKYNGIVSIDYSFPHIATRARAHTHLRSALKRARPINSLRARAHTHTVPRVERRNTESELHRSTSTQINQAALQLLEASEASWPLCAAAWLALEAIYIVL